MEYDQPTKEAIKRLCENVWDACPWAAPDSYVLRKELDKYSPFGSAEMEELAKEFGF